MKKNDLVITTCSVKHNGVLNKPGTRLKIGKDIELSLARTLHARGVVERYFEEDKALEDERSVEEMAEVEDLISLNIKQLKAVCKHLGISGYSKLKESELIALIEEARNADSEINLDDLDEEALRILAEEEGIDLLEDIDAEKIREILEAELSE